MPSAPYHGLTASRVCVCPCAQATRRRSPATSPSTCSCRTPTAAPATAGTASRPTSWRCSTRPRRGATLTCRARAGTASPRAPRASRAARCPPAATAGPTFASAAQVRTLASSLRGVHTAVGLLSACGAYAVCLRAGMVVPGRGAPACSCACVTTALGAHVIRRNKERMSRALAPDGARSSSAVHQRPELAARTPHAASPVWGAGGAGGAWQSQGIP